MLHTLLALCLLPAQPPVLPTITLTAPSTEVAQSCRIVIPPGTVLADAGGTGVIRVTADNVRIEFADGSILQGSPASAAPDTFTGTAIRIDGHTNVTILGANIEGYKVGIHATSANGLTLDRCRFNNLWRMHLLSTAKAEDGADWLWPHNNDQHEWCTNYGAAACIESSTGVTVRDCTARNGQNGLILDRVTAASVFDNDFSFLSGWGLAMWRSSDNIVARNALDFSVRGYSHGVYNRGQDSAGILMFEQCNKNTIIENSVTHGGDGFFGFAGKEAIGDPPSTDPNFDYVRKGCNDNLLIGNDFSYAPAHGIEMTFSHGNRFSRNRLVENAICGIWGGYSQSTMIDGNDFTGNGLKGAGEGGGINIEHGYANIIVSNRFENNTVGVAFWANPSEGLQKLPGIKANHKGSDKNRIELNTFTGDTTAIRVRNSPSTSVAANTYTAVAKEIDADATSSTGSFASRVPEPAMIKIAVPGNRTPVGARPELRGRHNIIMTPWGPWDHQSPLVRLVDDQSIFHTYALYKLPDGELDVSATPDPAPEKDAPAESGVTLRIGIPSADDPGFDGRMLEAKVLSEEPGIHPYILNVAVGPFKRTLRGTIINSVWTVRFFPTPTDPRTDEPGWHAAADGQAAVECETSSLKLRFGMNGPSQLALAQNVSDANLPRDHFGTLARTVIPLKPGVYKVKTTSDDGIRVKVRTGAGIGEEGQTQLVIDDWTWHAPKQIDGTFRVEGATLQPVEITVEHFELDGYSVLDVEVFPAE